MTSIIIKDGDRRVEIKRIQDIRNKLPKEFTKLQESVHHFVFNLCIYIMLNQ